MSYQFYRFFPGDYMRDTMHLGWYEDLAYRRLIELYLMHGKPIRNDRGYIMRAIRAYEPEQQAAVDTVLAEFFVLKPDGWHQQRCDAEIKYRDGKSKKGKKAAAERWNQYKELHASAMRPQCIRNANQNQNHILNNTGNYTRGQNGDRSVERHQSSKPGPDGPKTQNPNNPARPGESWEQYTTRLRHESRKVREG